MPPASEDDVSSKLPVRLGSGVGSAAPSAAVPLSEDGPLIEDGPLSEDGFKAPGIGAALPTPEPNRTG
ncbi:MAG: hypothetical protein AAFR70_15215, partial [Pseudomonadota bacterium]